MNSQYTLKIDKERAKEMPMVDLAFEVLKAANTPFYYRDLMQEIAKIKGLSEEEMMQVIAQLYTEINIDGRFACVGGNLWGLKRWYPVDKSDEVGGKRPRIINDDDDDLDEEDVYAEEEVYADEEDFVTFDEDLEDLGDLGDFGDDDDEDFIDDNELDEAIDDELDEVNAFDDEDLDEAPDDLLDDFNPEDDEENT